MNAPAACCARCGLTVTWMDGFDPPEDGMPEGWQRTGRSGALRCLRCRRDLARLQAEREARREVGANGWQVKLAGQRAVVALEIERTGDPDNKIAARLGLGSAAVVRKMRQAIEAEREEAA